MVLLIATMMVPAWFGSYLAAILALIVIPAAELLFSLGPDQRRRTMMTSRMTT
jgi:hypothetical protein